MQGQSLKFPKKLYRHSNSVAVLSRHLYKSKVFPVLLSTNLFYRRSTAPEPITITSNQGHERDVSVEDKREAQHRPSTDRLRHDVTSRQVTESSKGASITDADKSAADMVEGISDGGTRMQVASLRFFFTHRGWEGRGGQGGGRGFVGKGLAGEEVAFGMRWDARPAVGVTIGL